MTNKHIVEKPNQSYKVWDFMRWNCLAFGISSVFLISSIVTMLLKGFNWGIVFTGGIIIEVTLDQPIDLDQVRNALHKTSFKEILVQNLGSNKNIILRMPSSYNRSDFKEQGMKKIVDIIKNVTHQNAKIKRIEFVGPSVGFDLIQISTTALLAAMVCIFVYVSFRFEWRIAVGIMIALVHDILITIGMLSLFYVEIDLTIVASLVSVIGYSLNDSIVISDRIRENFRKIHYGTPYDIFNISLTQTLYRTLITSGTTLMAVLILYFFGGPILQGFSLTMLIGISIGTASSIYIASALTLQLGMKRELLL